MEDITTQAAENAENTGNQTAGKPNQELVNCKTDLANAQERVARLQADFENYKRRTEKDRLSWSITAQSGILVDVIAIADDFDRAMQEARKSAAQNPALTNWIAGFEMIEKSLAKMLSKHGVQEIKEYGQFDPEKHEAIMQVDAADHETGHVVAVLQKGYTFKDTILRPAKVSVAK